MADFLTNLWESVFTPGTTPTLLIATNVTFAALQVVLAGLLAATHSIHFAILSFLSAGLWYSINWFASELQAAQAKEQEAERLRRKKRGEGSSSSSGTAALGDAADQADDEGEDTEVEGASLRESTASLGNIRYDAMQIDEEVDERMFEAMKASARATAVGGNGSSGGGTASGLQAPAGAHTSRLRRVDDGDRSGDLSTDSEWEKIDEAR